MKKHRVLWLSSTLAAWAALALVAASPALADKVAVVTEEMAPYNFIDEKDKSVKGLSTELVHEILKRASIDYQIEIFPWARSYRMAQENPNVAIYSMGRNEEREKMFKWVGIIVNREVFLYKLKGRPEVKAASVAELKSYKLGGIRDGVRTMYLKKEGLTVEEATDDASNLKKLQSKRIDAFPIDEPNLVYLSEKNGVDFDSMERLLKLEKMSGGLYMAFSIKTPDETVEKCRAALDSMVKDGTFNKITAKWLKKK
ncbi:MAG: transporter substrate-binding domain-containing protein [Pseudomonadota bacterium]